MLKAPVAIATAGRPAPKLNLLVLDDFFPNLTTGFRVAEYTHYLRVLPGLVIASTIGDFQRRHAEFARVYPDLQHRVVAFEPTMLSTARLCYFNFLNNAHSHVEALEAARLPFYFTLYPGGGFELHSDETDRKLARLLRSPMLRAVISTQPVTTEVLHRMRCPVEIHEIFGVTINPVYLHAPRPRPRPAPGAAAKICFAAHKYDPHGRSKGYPVFIDVAAGLAERHPALQFSVAGNFEPADLEIPDVLRSRLAFRGLLSTSQLQRFLLTQDLLISPNQPYTLSGSVFDGFPTATCVEASLCGVAILCSDELNLNRSYQPDEMLICRPDSAEILELLEPLMLNGSGIAELGERGRQRSASLFSAQEQLLSRSAILRQLAAREGVAA